MAKTTMTRLIDDIDGTDADETVEFALDGVRYEIDLSTVHAKELRDVFGPYVRAGTKAGGGGRVATRTAVSDRTGREQAQKIRVWAAQNGHELASRGRISKPVVDAFEAAHQG